MPLSWRLIKSTFKKQVDTKARFPDGLAEIKLLLGRQSKLFDGFDEQRIQNQFNSWLKGLVAEEELPQHIKSLHFGLFEMVDPDNDENFLTTIYFDGSPFTPDEDDDWSCVVPESFQPENRYLVLDDFSLLDKKRRDVSINTETEILVFNGLLNLLLVNAERLLQQYFLPNHKTLYIGAGFDSGDIYVLGTLSEKGLK